MTQLAEGDVADIDDIVRRVPRGLLIGGSWIDPRAGGRLESINPSNGQVLATFAEGDADDIDAAVVAARVAFEGPWGRWKPYDRQRALIRLADLVERDYGELSLLDSLDMGMPWARSRISQRNVGLLHWYAAAAVGIRGETIPNSAFGDHLSFTVKEPVGVVGAIIPWNAPLTTAIWKLGPILATGCTAVFKPAQEASLTALKLGELCLEAGFPDGVVNVVTGGISAGAGLASHRDVDKITFTGSYETARAIIEASVGNIKRLTLELGGKSPDIVFADADIDAAVPGAAMAIFTNAGQVCSAGSRLFVERPIYEEFVARVSAFASSLRVGPSLDLESQMGPVVSQGHLQRVMKYLDAGKSAGATVSAGGERLTDPARASGYFVAPTVFSDVRDDMTIAREEIFGPVLCAMPFDDLDEVARRANSTEYGLGGGIWTSDIGKALELTRKLRVGTVWVNHYQNMDPGVPFGGHKMSGYGKESGNEQIDEYLLTKSVWLKASAQ